MNERDFEKILKSLANRRRLAILKVLKKRKEASVGNIASEIKLSFRSTSKHLSILFGASILEREQRSKQMFYKIYSATTPLTKALLPLL
jgi:DNA-binding transcriptional ArsR family regulator